ncbi:MAG TPA: hypothetical protein IAC59_08550 [Candidatus Fimadaptatus faecigallinarum]|uniref:EamA domain-containing protein n=1 Tax=Candidatus Fimadaptatus faecigallinarum TaxID=2840814 RepID=A0A9D1LSQ1_9FIRM|nr:hypothetical protein [Candidatus Fimadaptatus faecigallinarum]
MQYIVASVLSFIVQNMSNKEFSRRLPCKLHGLALFNAIALTFCAGALAVAGGIGTLSGGAWLLALAFAITFDVTVVLIVISMSMGPMGATVLIINMSMMLPVTAGLVVWGEQLTLLKGLGIACMLLVLILSALGSGGDSKRGGVKWLALTIITMISNGVLSIQQKMLSMYFPNDGVLEFSFGAFGLASLICWLAVALFKLRGASYQPWLSHRAALTLCAAGVGFGTAGGNTFQLMSLAMLPAIVAFPLVQGSVVLALWVLSLIVYRDKVTLPGILSLVAGIAGIVMLSI